MYPKVDPSDPATIIRWEKSKHNVLRSKIEVVDLRFFRGNLARAKRSGRSRYRSRCVTPWILALPNNRGSRWNDFGKRKHNSTPRLGPRSTTIIGRSTASSVGRRTVQRLDDVHRADSPDGTHAHSRGFRRDPWNRRRKRPISPGWRQPSRTSFSRRSAAKSRPGHLSPR